MFSLGSPVEIKNPVPASQIRFSTQFRAIERFCVTGSNGRNDRGTLGKNLENFYWAFLESVDIVIFGPAQNH